MTIDAEPARKKLLIKLGAALAVVLGLAALVLAGVDLKALIGTVLELVRGAGPATFFGAMALLPAVGVPFLTFMLPAVPVFGPQLGTPTVVALGLLAAFTNIAFTYSLARWGLRPLVAQLMVKLGFKLPEVESGDQTDLLVILRVTPGIPFFAQHYLLGLAHVPFGRYLLLSSLLSLPQVAALMLFSDALLHGRGKIIFLSAGALVALTAMTHLLRRHYGRKKKSA